MSPDLPDYSRSRAILIGTSAYRDPAFPPVPAAANSLKGLTEVLVDGQLCRWPADRVTAVRDAADIRQLITSLRRWARDTEDVLLVYFVGHGTITPRGELCLAISDTEFSDPDVTGIEYERIRSALLDSPARIKVVILDCCYSGRAIQALSHPADLADITDVRGAYTITASDHAAHVPPPEEQDSACTSFTGELLDLIRTGIPGGPDMLTLNMIYAQLRARLRSRRLPAPNQRGTDTVGEFAFTRNAALLPEPLARFPRPEPPPAGRPWRQVLAVAAAAVAAAAVTLAVTRPGGQGAGAQASSCSPATAMPGSAATRGTVVVGSADFPESELLGYIWLDALRARGIRAVPDFDLGPRRVYYPEVCDGQVSVMPEYNGQLLTTELDPGSPARSTAGIDAAARAALPPSLAILGPSPAQDRDSVTVTRATAARYHLTSIAGLRRAGRLVFAAPPEFQGDEQGKLGLARKYGLAFAGFESPDDGGSGPLTIRALVSGSVTAADVFTTSPWIQADHLVTLADPRHVFIAENIVPLIYRSAITPAAAQALDSVCALLTTKDLIRLNAEVMISGESPAAVAREWLQQAAAAVRRGSGGHALRAGGAGSGPIRE